MYREESVGSNSGVAATHDSDPRLLRFETYDRETGITTELGDGPIELDIAGNPMPIPPAVYSPTVLSDLVGGSFPGSSPVVNDLTAGDMHITLICTDETQLIGTITNAQVQALVIAQGQTGQTDGTLDLSSVFSIDSLVGKTIDSITALISTPYASSVETDFANTLYSFQAHAPDIYELLVDTKLAGGPFANGPGRDLLVLEEYRVCLLYTILGYEPTNNAVVAYIAPPSPTLYDITLGGFEAQITCDELTAPTIDNLTDGGVSIVINCTDASQLVHELTNAEVQALVIAQGQEGQSGGTLDLSTTIPLTALIGKTIASIWMYNNINYTSSVQIDKVTSYYALSYYESGQGGPVVTIDLTDYPTYAVNSSLSQLVGPTARLAIMFSIVGMPIVVTVQTSVSTFQAVAEDLGGGTWRASAAAMGWDLSGMVGKTMNDIVHTTTPGFTGNNHLDLPNSTGELHYNPAYAPLYNHDLTDTTPIDNPVVPSRPFTSPADWWLYITLVPASYFGVPFYFDALAIQSLASVNALASDAWADCIPGQGDITWPTSILEPYIGWTLYGVAISNYPVQLPYTIDYGPGPFDPTNVLAFSFVGVDSTVISPYTSGTVNGVNVLCYQASGIIIEGATMVMQNGTISPVSWRISTLPAPTTLPLLFTEPYELRSRNLPAFYFDITGPTLHSEVPTYNAIMFISQDGTHWSPCLLDGIAGDWTGTTVIGDEYPPEAIHELSARVYEITNMGGYTIFPAKEFVGPWNYIKFLIYAQAPSGQPPVRHEHDLAGIFLQIIANAREI